MAEAIRMAARRLRWLLVMNNPRFEHAARSVIDPDWLWQVCDQRKALRLQGLNEGAAITGDDGHGALLPVSRRV